MNTSNTSYDSIIKNQMAEIHRLNKQLIDNNKEEEREEKEQKEQKEQKEGVTVDDLEGELERLKNQLESNGETIQEL